MPVRMALLTPYSAVRPKASDASPASAAKMTLAIAIDASLRRVEMETPPRSKVM